MVQMESGKGMQKVSPSKVFVAFLRLGLTAFGGPAMVAYIGDLSVKRKGWISQNSFKDGVALCQSIPGATAMQAAAYVRLRGGSPCGHGRIHGFRPSRFPPDADPLDRLR